MFKLRNGKVTGHHSLRRQWRESHPEQSNMSQLIQHGSLSTSGSSVKCVVKPYMQTKKTHKPSKTKQKKAQTKTNKIKQQPIQTTNNSKQTKPLHNSWQVAWNCYSAFRYGRMKHHFSLVTAHDVNFSKWTCPQSSSLSKNCMNYMCIHFSSMSRISKLES